jgi:hypothetical protein
MKNFILLSLVIFAFSACGPISTQTPLSASGVSKASTIVQTDDKGNTVEQRNIIERLKRDNEPGSIKHLYVISAYSG